MYVNKKCTAPWQTDISMKTVNLSKLDLNFFTHLDPLLFLSVLSFASTPLPEDPVERISKKYTKQEKEENATVWWMKLLLEQDHIPFGTPHMHFKADISLAADEDKSYKQESIYHEVHVQGNPCDSQNVVALDSAAGVLLPLRCNVFAALHMSNLLQPPAHTCSHR